MSLRGWHSQYNSSEVKCCNLLSFRSFNSKLRLANIKWKNLFKFGYLFTGNKANLFALNNLFLNTIERLDNRKATK